MNSPSQSFTCVEQWHAPACQPYGAALFLDSNGIIVTLTDTASHFLGAPNTTLLLGQSISVVCPPLFDIWNDQLEGFLDPRDWTHVSWNNHIFDARAVPCQGYWLLDVWPAGDTSHGWEDVQNVATIVRDWLQHKEFNLNEALGYYREWLDFDTALVYKLEPTGEGEIIAEHKNDDIQSLLGLHYPVSQLGNFAQALGNQNVARNIVNIQARATTWWTITSHIPIQAAELSVCRELDGDHTYRMGKLGFKAALMLPIVMDGEVRGLLLAYSKKERTLGGVTLLVARTFAQSLSLKMNEYDLRNKFAYNHNLVMAKQAFEKTVLTLSKSTMLLDLMSTHGPLLLSTVNAQGVFRRDANTNEITYFGHDNIDLNSAALKRWIEWLDTKIPLGIGSFGTGIYATDFLAGSYDFADETLHHAAGVLAIRAPNRDIVVFTRHQTARSIDTSDRNKWRHTYIRRLYGHALPWAPVEILNAKALIQIICTQFIDNKNIILDIKVNYDNTIIYALDGRILYMNPVARELTQWLHGVESKQTLAMKDILHTEDNESLTDAMETAFHQGVWRGSLRLKKQHDHIEHQTILSGALRKHKVDQDIYFSWTGFDVTASKRAQDELIYIDNNEGFAFEIQSIDFRARLALKLSENLLGYNTTHGALLLVDLDGSKNFIKLLGEQDAERIGLWFHRRLLHILGRTVEVCHLGSDEFAIIIPKIENEQHVLLIAQIVLQNISSSVCLPEWPPENALQLTGCIGIATFPLSGNNAQDILAAADNAMFAAKRSGRGQIRMHDAESSVSVSQKFHIAGELRRAIVNNEFRAFLQPQYDLRTKTLIGAEALVRWQHPERGLIPPSMFIHVAEESGLIDKIGEWILRDTLRQMSTWPKEIQQKLKISINASVRQLRDKEHFLHIVDSALTQYGILASSIEIEITETIWMGSNDEAVDTLIALRERGISIAIDDFGTGYSNIAYLQSFPVDKLKFDRTFIVAGAEKQEGKAIIFAMVQLAKALNVDIIAEGVETQSQEDMLLEVGVYKVQGFAYGYPMAEKAFLKFIQLDPTPWKFE